MDSFQNIWKWWNCMEYGWKCYCSNIFCCYWDGTVNLDAWINPVSFPLIRHILTIQSLSSKLGVVLRSSRFQSNAPRWRAYVWSLPPHLHRTFIRVSRTSGVLSVIHYFSLTCNRALKSFSFPSKDHCFSNDFYLYQRFALTFL